MDMEKKVEDFQRTRNRNTTLKDIIEELENQEGP